MHRQLKRKELQAVLKLGHNQPHAHVKNDNRENGADEGLEHALGHERPADEAVGRADETHDGNLATTSGNGQANRVVDEHERDKGQKGHEHDRADAQVVGDAKQTLDRLATVLDRIRRVVVVVCNLLEVGVGGQLRSDVLNALGVLEGDDERGGNRILTIERRDRVGGVAIAHRLLVLVERLLLALVGNGVHAAPALDLRLEGVNILLVGVVGNKRLDGDTVLDAADEVRDHYGADDEQADDEQREEDRDDCAKNRRPVPAEVTSRLAKRITNVRGHHSNRSLPSPDRGPRDPPQAR